MVEKKKQATSNKFDWTKDGSLDEASRFEAMLKWLQGGKAKFPDLYIKYYDVDYRGIHATKEIAADKVIMEIPVTRIMTTDIAKASKIGQKIMNSGCQLRSNHSYLACFLLQEKVNKASFWGPFLRILPRVYRNIPTNFTDEELKYLKGSLTEKKISERKEQIAKEYENICKHVPSLKTFTLEEFNWARLVVITRIFGMAINGHRTDGLVPMADMLNHKRPCETSWTFDDTKSAFTITTLKAMKADDQVHDSYGRKCNSRFFVNYGFALEENEDNQALFNLAVPANDPHYSMKSRFLASTSQSFQIPMDYGNKATQAAFSYLRIAHAQDTEVALLSAAFGLTVKDIQPMSLRNELAVVSSIAAAAKKALEGFETSIEKDNSLLSDSKKEISANVRNAILMRRGEKRVFKYYITLEKLISKLSGKSWAQAQVVAAEAPAFKDKYVSQYFATVLVPLFKTNNNRVTDVLDSME